MQFLLRNFRKHSVSTSFSTLQASIFRVATRRGLVVGYRRFRTWLSLLSSKIRPIGYPETSVTSYQLTPCNLPELHLEFSGSSYNDVSDCRAGCGQYCLPREVLVVTQLM